MLKGTPVLSGEMARYVLKPNRDWLIARIARRFEAMMAAGALEEVRALRDGGLSRALPSARALGVPQLMAHLDGRLTLEASVEQAIVQTRQYAKRQTTWFRHQMPDWTVIERSEVGEMAEIISQSLG